MTDERLTADGDVVTKLSAQSVRDAAAKLSAMISAKGLKLFAVIDQAAEAREVGLTLRETTLVIFGSPKAGTPVMAASPLFALRPAAQGADLGRRRPDQSLLLRSRRASCQASSQRRPGRHPVRHQRADRCARGFLAPNSHYRQGSPERRGLVISGSRTGRAPRRARRRQSGRPGSPPRPRPR